MKRNKARIFFMGDDAVVKSAKRAIRTVCKDFAEIIDNLDKADVIFLRNIREVSESFDTEKRYILVPEEPVKSNLPPNILCEGLMPEITSWANFIKEVVENLKDDVQEEEMPQVELLPDALRILVIDDNATNRESALRTLSGHKLTIAPGYKTAMQILASEEFDVVLSDLYLPMAPDTLGEKAFRLGELVPYGFLLMLEACRQGAKYVAVVTDLGHHSDHFSAAFDHFCEFNFAIDGATAKMLQIYAGQRGKDWSRALKVLMGGTK